VLVAAARPGGEVEVTAAAACIVNGVVVCSANCGAAEMLNEDRTAASVVDTSSSADRVGETTTASVLVGTSIAEIVGVAVSIIASAFAPVNELPQCPVWVCRPALKA
jgi:hypothetical protein